MAMSEGEILMASILRGMGIGFKTEIQFHPVRHWRFDFVIVNKMIAIEIEGGTYGPQVICNHCGKPVFMITKLDRKVPIRKAGRHNSGEGFEADCEKYNEADVLGWHVLRFTTRQLADKQEWVKDLIRRAICLK